MERFCTDGAMAAMQKKERRLTLVFRALACVLPVMFIVLCLMIRTENAGTMLRVLIACTAVLGWACILLYYLGVSETRTQIGHMKMLADGEPEILEGRITMTRESIQIPRSIRIRKVLLDTGGEEPERLNLDEQWVSLLPPDGSRVRLAVVHSYIAGAETLEAAEGMKQPSGGAGSARKAARLIPLLGIWALASVFLSSFVFYQVTDTDPLHKITIYMDGTVANEARLAARLEKGLEAPVRMVQIHPFSYFMFGSEILKAGDLFIVPDSDREQFAEWFAEGGEEWLLYDPESGKSVAGDTFLYTVEGKNEPWRLYTGASSPHLEDGLARRAAELLINLDKEETK